MSPGEPPRPAEGQGALRGAFPRPFGKRYLLMSHLATGGMADVFLARQIGGAGFVKECVIKRILPHLVGDKQFVTMFLDEARLCARLNHPNIAQVYDHGQVGEDYFIAMEHVDGVDLDQILDKVHAAGERRLPFPIAARIVASVAEGLEHAHRAVDENGVALGLVHRDVTPSNIVVSFEGVPKLLDFGIAKASSKQAKTEVGIVKGKIPYMSPEQVQGEELDGRSDVFALGAILFELTTGEKPFNGDNQAQIGLRILHDEPTPPTLLVADYPEPLEAIVLAALAKRVADRTQSARAMQMALERYLVQTGQSVTAHDVAEYLADRFPRQRKVIDPEAVAAAQSAQAAQPESGRVMGGMGGPVNNSRPTGPMTIGVGLSLEGGQRQPTRRNLGGGGGPWMGVVAGLLVLVAGVFYYLHNRELKKEERATVEANAAAEVVAPKPIVAPPKEASAIKDPPPAADKAAAPLAPSVAPPPLDKPAVAPAATAPPIVKPAPVARAVEPKKPAHPKRPSRGPARATGGGGGHALPHLPSPPPPTE